MSASAFASAHRRCSLLVLMALALSGAGCRSLHVREPFPCSSHDKCPAPYRCGDDKMCRLVPVVDGSTDQRDTGDSGDVGGADRPDGDTDSGDVGGADRPGGDAEAGVDGSVDKPGTIGTGLPCSVNGDCSSGACVDGVCCENACTGACKSCAMAYTGQPDGKCVVTSAGKDPHDDCTAGTPEACGDDGTCDGAGACRKFGTSQVCVAAICSGTQFQPTRTCTGSGSCATVPPVECGAYPCSVSGCAKPCTMDNDCPNGNYCVSASGLCKAKKINGDTCTLMNECTSGQCFDGFCCNVMCNTLCGACSNAKTGQPSGQCAPIPAGQDYDNECAVGAACGLDGTCNGNYGCRITAANTPCGAAASCTGTNTFTPGGKCDGVNTCTPGGQQPCPGGFTCLSGSACRTSCTVGTAATDCVAGNYCSGSSCMPTKSLGGSCGSTSECTSGFCVDGVCCNNACPLAGAAAGMCMGCSNAVTGAQNGMCAARTASTTRPCPTVAPNSCTNVQNNPSNCGACGNVCPTSGLPANTTRACLFGTCGATCTNGGEQLCVPVTGTPACTSMAFGFESGSASPWGVGAGTGISASMAQHHSGVWALAMTQTTYPNAAATIFSIPCTSGVAGTMDVRGKTFSAWIFVANSASSYASTQCRLRATDDKLYESTLPATAMMGPIVPGSWFQLSTTFPTTAVESKIYQLTIQCYLPSDWLATDPTKVWYVDDVQIN